MSLLRHEDSLSLEQRQQIDETCLALEDQWLAGNRPVLESFLDQVDRSTRPLLLKELLLVELEYRRGMAELPNVDRYVDRFPEMESAVCQAFNWMAEHTIALRFPPGHLIGRYRVRQTIGTGAFGQVYLAWDERLQREVAVKVPHRSHGCSEQARQRLADEARAVARLRHRHIVAVYDAGQLEDGTLFIVMQYVAGQSLAEQLKSGPMEPGIAIEIAIQVAQAIGCAHRQGIIHRDLKPNNVLLDQNGMVHVVDFGLALQESGQPARTGEYAGTPVYMSPEQLRGEVAQMDGRADIWALGVVLYQMLVGKRPFRGTSRRELVDEVMTCSPRPIRQLEPRLPRSLERICARCIAKDPASRYGSAADVEYDLRRCHGVRHSRVRWWPMAAGTLLLTAVAGLAMLMPRQTGPASAVKPASPTLTGNVDLIVCPANSADGTEIRLSETDGNVALRPNDQVRVRVRMNRAAYLYVVWLDTHGKALPVYPWLQGDWDRRPAAEPPHTNLYLPERLDEAWVMGTAPAGMETILLLARNSPLPTSIDLPGLVSKLPAASIPLTARVLRFQHGCLSQVPTPTPARKKRAPDLMRTRKLNAPMRILQQRIVDTVGPHFDLIQTVSFPVHGAGEAPTQTAQQTIPVKS